ncbi:transcriptional regulator of PTS gene [Phyllobacterium sp. CL33Tsu]|uniref:ROK family protein n=1 Tax=Phyllobacterium sp. CL33Tsu TaxID=1798191 RepID=UPI0008E75F34|nr:ROK family protein [Phyllobacterium sp. CL33Tsu]SFJ48709.1 transcriptional regulator of PTS gene [Phyllobacterium sp. CL33Tsu]
MILTIDETRYEDAHQRDCARVAALLSDGESHSRPNVSEALQMTSTTTSRVVADLLERGLVIGEAGEKSGRGRPAIQIALNHSRLGATVILMSSRSLLGVLVDLSGRVIGRCTADVPESADNDTMAARMRGLINSLLKDLPAGMSHMGTSVSVSGVVNVRDRKWLITSRWPHVRDLDLAAALAPVTPVVIVCRHLDAELTARTMQDGAQGRDSTLLLHWGWGVGLAYSVEGEPFMSASNPFGEIGHWRFNMLDQRQCGCGNHGCLETAAALWALLPQLRASWPELSEDEERVAGQLTSLDIAERPEIATAIHLMARSLGNVCRLLFPKRVIVTGPFVGNTALWQAFSDAFQAEGIMSGLALPVLVADRSSEEYAILGAVRPLLNLGLETFIRS